MTSIPQRFRPWMLLVVFPVLTVLAPSIGASLLSEAAYAFGIHDNDLLFELFFAGPLTVVAVGFFDAWNERIREVLPSIRDALVAAAFVTAGWLALSGVLAAVMTMNGEELLLTAPGSDAWDVLSAIGFVLVTSAIPLEFAWRGYFQNRIVVAFHDRTGLAVVAATLGYTLWHVPFRLVTDVGSQSLAWSIGVIFLQGLAFAVAYELTLNLAFTALAQALFAEGTLLVYVYGGDVVNYVFSIGGLLALLGTALAYNRFGSGTRPEFRRPTNEAAVEQPRSTSVSPD